MAFHTASGLRGELRQRPILWFVIGCFIFETGMNAIFGYRQAGGGLSLAALLYGFIFVCLAFLGAWSCVELFRIRGEDGAAWARRLAYAVPFAGCLAVSQFSGWGVLGVTLADGGLRREVAATASITAAETLAMKKAQRAALELPAKARETLAAELSLELRKTSRAYPDGDGPEAMRLKAGIAAWDKADALDREIAEAMTALESKPAVAGGHAEFAVVTDFTAATPEAVRKWWSVFLVALIGFFANFGFALAGVGQDAAPAAKPAPFLEQFAFGPRALAAGPGVQAFYDDLVRMLGAAEADRVIATGDPQVAALTLQLAQARRLPEPRDHRASDAVVSEARFRHDASAQVAKHTPSSDLPPPRAPLSGDDPPPFPKSFYRGASVTHAYAHADDARLRRDASAPVHQHAAPIAIHNHFSGGTPEVRGVAPSALPQEALQASRDALPATMSAGSPAAALPPPVPLRPVTTGAPVDRTHARVLHDQLLAFKACCLAPLRGGRLAGDDVYAAYAAWAGPRALSRPSFFLLFGELAGVAQIDVADTLVYCDVDLAAGAAAESA